MEPTWILLNFLVCVGMIQVCMAFVVLLPGVGTLLSNIWLTIMGERLLAKSGGRPSGSDIPGVNV
ncbi:MAG: hypothetical protein D6798_00220 [Deltaproteobacteria bacterium]|nr:MAG: hypothetical protein D6798_00220 [Deltaproteobacteria bacterium]